VLAYNKDVLTGTAQAKTRKVSTKGRSSAIFARNGKSGTDRGGGMDTLKVGASNARWGRGTGLRGKMAERNGGKRSKEPESGDMVR